MLRKKLKYESGESEPSTEIVDSGFLIIYEKPAIPEYNISKNRRFAGFYIPDFLTLPLLLIPTDGWVKVSTKHK